MSEFRFWGFFLVLPCSLPSSVHHSWHIWYDYAWPIERWNVRMSRLFCPNLKEIGFVTDWLQVTELCAGICLALLPQFSAAISNCCQFYRILEIPFSFQTFAFLILLLDTFLHFPLMAQIVAWALTLVWSALRLLRRSTNNFNVRNPKTFAFCQISSRFSRWNLLRFSQIF